MKKQCEARTRDGRGRQCKRTAQPGKNVCHFHDDNAPPRRKYKRRAKAAEQPEAKRYRTSGRLRPRIGTYRAKLTISA